MSSSQVLCQEASYNMTNTSKMLSVDRRTFSSVEMHILDFYPLNQASYLHFLLVLLLVFRSPAGTTRYHLKYYRRYQYYWLKNTDVPCVMVLISVSWLSSVSWFSSLSVLPYSRIFVELPRMWLLWTFWLHTMLAKVPHQGVYYQHSMCSTLQYS